MLDEAPKPIGIAMIKAMQGDNYDQMAPVLVPEIMKLDFSDPDLTAAQDILSRLGFSGRSGFSTCSPFHDFLAEPDRQHLTGQSA